MNIPVDHDMALIREAVPPRVLPLAEASVIHPGPALCVVFFDRPKGLAGRRLSADHDGREIPKPFMTARLDLLDGGRRHVLLLPAGREALLSRHLLLRLDDRPVAEIDPLWLQPPEAEMPALVDDLTGAALNRLIRLLLSTGAALFTGEAAAGLAAAAVRLMDLCGIPVCQPVARSEVAGRRLLSYSVPGAAELAAPTDQVALPDGRIQRLPALACLAEAGSAGGPDLLHVLLPAGSPPCEVVAFAGRVLRLAPPAPGLRRLSPTHWLDGRGDAVRDWLNGQARSLGAGLLDGELAPDAVEPALKILHLCATGGAVLHALTLSDPSRLVRAVVLESGAGRTELAVEHDVTGTARITGLAPLPQAAPGREIALHLACHSGRLRLLGRRTLGAYDGGRPPGFEDAWRIDASATPEAVPEPSAASGIAALALARAGFRRPAPPIRVLAFGPPVRPALRLLTSVSASRDILRARAAAIFAEAPAQPVEVVCTMAEGPLALAAREALAETAEIYGIAHRLVLLPATATAGESLHAALGQSHGAPALLLGPEVLPLRAGWMRFWLRALRRREMVGGTLLAADGAIVGAAAVPERHSGLPADTLPGRLYGVRRPRTDCLGLGAAAVARLSATPPHPDPDLWMAGAATGGINAETGFPFGRMAAEPVTDAFGRALADAGFALIAGART